MRLLTCLGFSLLLAGCAASSSGYYTQSVQSWRGGNAKDLVKVWGTPNSTMADAGGGMVYVYKRQNFYNSNSIYAPSIGVNSVTGTPVITAMPNVNTPWNRGLSAYCLATFTANAEGQIVDTFIQGTNCYISESRAKALANPKSNK